MCTDYLVLNKLVEKMLKSMDRCDKEVDKACGYDKFEDGLTFESMARIASSKNVRRSEKITTKRIENIKHFLYGR